MGKNATKLGPRWAKISQDEAKMGYSKMGARGANIRPTWVEIDHADVAISPTRRANCISTNQKCCA